MSRAVILLFILALTGCGADPKPRLPVAGLESLFREYDKSSKGHWPDVPTKIKIDECRIDGLYETLGIQLFFVNYIPARWYAMNRAYLCRNEELTYFVTSYCGHGLMSAVMSNGKLYYTYSFGSGVHRSHVGQLSVDGDRILKHESTGYPSINLFVRRGASKVVVEKGRFSDFNSWQAQEVFGWLKPDSSPLLIIDQEGKEVTPKPSFINMKLKTETGEPVNE